MINRHSVPEYPKNISIGLSEGYCNLACPKCPVHGTNKRVSTMIKGQMPMERVAKIIDELKGEETVVAIEGYTEPLIQKNAWECLEMLRTGFITSLTP